MNPVRVLSSVWVGLALGACTAPELQRPLCESFSYQQGDTYKELYKEQVEDWRKCEPIYPTYVGSAQLDLLLVIDNSPGMAPKQRILAERIPEFVRALEATGADYHIGIVTTDVGTLPAEDASFPGPQQGRCNTFAGDDGVLQNTACKLRQGVSAEDAVPACDTMCPDPSFVPKNGERYIVKTNGYYNLPTQSSTGVAVSGAQAVENALRCMVLVGDGGCEVESPLESAKRALQGHAFNAGFLRSNSVLAVLFVTDEDDCSVQPRQRLQNDPAEVACAASQDAPYGCFNRDYRCLARSVQCDQPMNATGPKTGCRERPETYLEPVDKYVKFFSNLRGPRGLLIGGLWSPSLLDAVPGDPRGQLYVEDVGGSLGRGLKGNAACFNPAIAVNNPQEAEKGFIGQAQLRLSRFIRQFPEQSRDESTNICAADGYASAFRRIAQKLSAKVTLRCLGVVPLLTDDVPACEVSLVDKDEPERVSQPALPVCGGGSSSACCQAWARAEEPRSEDPDVVAACRSEPQTCFCALPAALNPMTNEPKDCAESAIGAVWYKSPDGVRAGSPELGKVARFACRAPRKTATSYGLTSR